MYNDASAAPLADRIGALAPAESGAHGATSPLARLLAMQDAHASARYALHQADWLAAQLTRRFGVSDDNNALKLGWDPVHRTWPAWLDRLGARRELLPEVVPPGTPLGPVHPEVAAELGLAGDCLVVAGTTDGCASFLATGAAEQGDGVTALGSTLTIKLLARQPIFAPEYGVYSHRLGDLWLAGGAANTGGAALLRFFSAECIAELTAALRPEEPTGLDWHPLPGRGERFPVADPELTFEPGPAGRRRDLPPGTARGDRCGRGARLCAARRARRAAAALRAHGRRRRCELRLAADPRRPARRTLAPARQPGCCLWRSAAGASGLQP